jgi:hypothetical protein
MHDRAIIRLGREYRIHVLRLGRRSRSPVVRTWASVVGDLVGTLQYSVRTSPGPN